MVKTLSYKNSRNMIEDGDVIFLHKDRTFSSIVISFFTRSKYVHVATAFWITTGDSKRLMVVEADVSTNRRIVNLGNYEGRGMTVLSGIKPWNEKSSIALDKISKVKYSILEVIYAGLRDIVLKSFGWKLPAFDMPGEICSELVARIEGLDDINISPGRLYADLILANSNHRFNIKAD